MASTLMASVTSREGIAKPFARICYLLSGRLLFTSSFYNTRWRRPSSRSRTDLEQYYNDEIKMEMDDDDCEDTIERGHEYYDMYQREKIEHQNRTRRAIVISKVFKEPPGPNLLTWAAKEQIRYLSRLDPIEWSPERLAESFPITANGIKRLLKSKFVYADEDRIRSHDFCVMRNWKLLKEGKWESVDPRSRHMWLSRGTFELHSQGNKQLPFPSSKIVLERKVPKQTRGEFSAIVEPYLSLKFKPTESAVIEEYNSITQNELGVATSNEADSRASHVNVGSKAALNQRHVQNEDFTDLHHASYHAADDRIYAGPYVTQAQYKKNILEAYDRKKDYSDVDAAMHQWLENKRKQNKNIGETPQTNEKETSSYVHKFSRDNVELNVEDKQSYMYDSAVGYQFPFGKLESDPEQIDIPTNMRKRGRVYKVRQSYYDEDGMFLYKVPWK